MAYQPDYVPSGFVNKMVEEEEVDLKDDQLNSTAFIDDEATTNIGSLIDSKDQGGEGANMIIEDMTEKEVLFNVYNGFFQFTVDDHSVPKTEYGIVDFQVDLGHGKLSNE